MWPQASFSQRATCPPSAAVRQRSIALITFNWPKLTWPRLASRQAAPWSRKISATSRAGRGMRRLLRRRLALAGLLGPFAWCVEPVERALDRGDEAGGDPRIARRRLQLRMSEQRLDHSDIDAAIIEVRGKAVPKRVQVDGLGDAGGIGGFVEQPVELPGRQMQSLAATGEQPALGHGHAEVIFVRAQRPPFLQQRTDYRVFHPSGAFTLRVGRHSSELAALMSEHGASAAVFI